MSVTSTAVISLVGVLVGALVTALANYYLQRAADNRRWRREEEAQRRRWEREDQVHFQSEKLRVYREFLAEANRAEVREIVDQARMFTLLQEVHLLFSSYSYSIASSIYMVLVDLWGTEDEEPTRKVPNPCDRLNDATYHFHKAVRIELEVPDELLERKHEHLWRVS